MSPLEYSQYIFLLLASLLTPSGDLYDAACRGTNLLFREYHQGLCPEARSWDDVRQSLDYKFFFPSAGQHGEESWPVVILMHGASSAHSLSMVKRRQFFLEQGFAVLIPDSFTPGRVMAGLPDDGRDLYAPQSLGNAAFTHRDDRHRRFQDRVTQGYALLPAVRAPDVHVALDIARNNPRINSKAIYMVGYSHGASAALEALTLHTLNKPAPGMESPAPGNNLEGIQSVVLYYPSCRPGNYFPWHKVWPSIPTLMIMGTRDELCGLENCQLVNRVINQNAGFEVIEELLVEGDHNFDMEEFPQEYDVAAEQKARSKTLDFISRHNPSR